MAIQLTAAGLRAIFPRAPQEIIDELVKGQWHFDRAGITASRTRLAYCLANVEHECAGFTIKNLTESTAYSAARAADVWPSRFKDARDCYAKLGASSADMADFRKKLINSVYGGRMGNRPGTDDGWTFIGRSGAQITGRDGYAEMAKRTGLDLVNSPDLATRPENQATIIAAFWSWKDLSRFADLGDFRACVKAWNGGYNGFADREALLNDNDPIVARLNNVSTAIAATRIMPGNPDTYIPPPAVIESAIRTERRAQGAGALVAVAGAGSEAIVSVQQPTSGGHDALPAWATYGTIGIAAVIILAAAVSVAKKRVALARNWF